MLVVKDLLSDTEDESVWDLRYVCCLRGRDTSAPSPLIPIKINNAGVYKALNHQQNAAERPRGAVEECVWQVGVSQWARCGALNSAAGRDQFLCSIKAKNKQKKYCTVFTAIAVKITLSHSLGNALIWSLWELSSTIKYETILKYKHKTQVLQFCRGYARDYYYPWCRGTARG